MNSNASPPFTGPDLCAREAHEIVALLRKRDIAPRDLVGASRARTDAVEPQINAMPTTCWDWAEAAIAALEGGDRAAPGWLGGLPIGIKDLTPVAGVRTTFGTKGLRDFFPATSDPLVDRLETRGALVVGKTNTPEMGAGANTFNDVFGPTLNPWNTRLNAGGSSGGAAAGLATGEVWLSHGSDHGGSLRTPAAYCGIVGLRPTPGRAGGASPNAGYLIESAQGPMARSVTDCALFLDTMAGFEPRFPISYPAPDAPFQEAVRRASGRLRIGYAPDLGGFSPVDAEMATHLNDAMAQLERSGANVEEACPDVTGLERTYHILRGISWVTAARTMDPAVRRHFKPTLEENTRFGEGLTIQDVADAQVGRTAIFNAMLAFFDRFDVLALPVVGCMPHPQSEEWVREIDGQTLTGYMDWLRFAFLATTAGLPAISVPVGLGPRGMPVGLQLVGKPRGEADLLAAARFVEMVMGGPLGPIDPVAG
ncbi:amidase [Roseovarius sp. M141]|uniref:amidase n=1 Tax=Roseovarius sp. M141 TaxID=2583806 RepID=UPI0020CBFFC8|nr:amidase family protein [Roseovarius sp. M141]MCQ0092131.1 amidase [Roseovarius sp. M141]